MTCSQTSLKPLNTFGLSVSAKSIVYASDTETLIDSWQDHQGKPWLLMGGGSNMLFLDDFDGTVVINQLKGISVEQTQDNWLIHCAAGENWHDFVQFTIKEDMPGLENLALIPGTVGSAPIQNIGAYGVELKDVCDYVDILDLTQNKLVRLTHTECLFGYRESIFKHRYQHGYVITAVGFRLPKCWQPNFSYGPLKAVKETLTTPKSIFDKVCEIRRSKLPDPAKMGNAGSFFKNPIISTQAAEAIKQHYPDAPFYPQNSDQVKIAAGWLIEQAGLKGYQAHGAGVHPQQALVLVNLGEAQPADVVSMAKHVRDTVHQKFSIWLEPEVRFIGTKGEVNAVDTLS
ncbi:UDP-N-acetylmuramate dehydrogenase [Rosenbergiella australiborealis]|uniref:UDP-N-acetylenolpyruvoylglucosamine reductase n=1 Tax=Rosenbergiella australiborealis TaxID=1544696 RepID=A0ABS5T8H1_9GAMM|nr:UDP-N-acetylmuramate dehydrogenase [Rosenbergiella australiborealis]MBT0728427.1 UDP-N-acetylmuramate dehydrogenase [Rosenbergiella australiborealis]